MFAFKLTTDYRYIVSISNKFISWDLSTSDCARDVCPQLEGIMQQLAISPDNKWAAAYTNNDQERNVSIQFRIAFNLYILINFCINRWSI